MDALESARIDSHLADCDKCQRSLNQLAVGALPEEHPVLSRKAEGDLASKSRGVLRAEFDHDPFSISSVQAQIDLRYLILDEIDRGGMGVVYRAFDRELQREIAIKLSSDQSDGDRAIRFRREAQISARLQHPGVIPIHQVGQLKDGRQYIAMKLVDGETLSSVIRDQGNPQPPTKLLAIFADICNTMAFAHSREIIHRDLKPENIMIGAFGEVQIMDWGLARKLDGEQLEDVPDHDFASIEAETTLKAKETQSLIPGETQVGSVMGTPAYMSPEQAHGLKADQRADVFSLGGILFEIITGQAPFDAPTATMALAKSIDSDLASAFARLDSSEADDPLIQLTKECLSAAPDQRPADGRVLSQKVADYLSNRERKFEENRLEKARTTERLIAQQKRNRQLIWSGGLIVTTLVALAVAGFLYLSEKNARLADSARIERETVAQRILAEAKIRTSLASATVYTQTAATRRPHLQYSDWVLAKKEIEKAASVATPEIGPELEMEIRELEEAIRLGEAVALRWRNRRQLEESCRNELFRLAEISNYPEDMALCKDHNLLPKINAVFEKLGIRPGVISHSAVERLTESEFRDDLFYGLMIWRREANARLDDKTLSRAEARKFADIYLWISELIDAADPDPFRTEVREHILNARFGRVVELAGTENATSSLLSVHTVAMALATLEINRDERLDFLLRAQQQFPSDFFVNWYLPTYGGGPNNAKKFALACYSLRPESPGVLSKLGFLYLSEGAIDNAIETLEKLVKVAPWYHLGQFRLAEAYHRKGKLEKADEQFKIAAKVREQVRGSIESRIEYLRDFNQFAEAEALELMLTQTQPQKRPEADGSRGVTDEKLSDEKTRLNKLIATQISLVENEPSLTNFRQLARQYRELCDLLNVAGRRFELDVTLHKAVEDFESLVVLAPELSAPYNELSRLCETFDQLAPAVAAIRKAISIAPVKNEYHARLERLFRKLCSAQRRTSSVMEFNLSVDEAIVVLNENSNQSPPDYPNAHESLASFCEFFRRYQTAIEAIGRLIETEPDQEAHRMSLATLYLKLGRQWELAGDSGGAGSSYDDAVSACESWIRDFPESYRAYEQLAYVYKHKRDFAAAMSNLKKSIDLKPGNAPARFRYSDLAIKLAKELHANDQLPEAIATLKKTLNYLKKIAPDGFLLDILDARADVQKDAGEYKSAIFALNNILLNKPNNHFVKERMADLCMASGDLEKAENLYLELVGANPTSVHLIEKLVGFYVETQRIDMAEQTIVNTEEKGVTSRELREQLRMFRKIQ